MHFKQKCQGATYVRGKRRAEQKRRAGGSLRPLRHATLRHAITMFDGRSNCGSVCLSVCLYVFVCLSFCIDLHLVHEDIPESVNVEGFALNNTIDHCTGIVRNQPWSLANERCSRNGYESRFEAANAL